MLLRPGEQFYTSISLLHSAYNSRVSVSRRSRDGFRCSTYCIHSSPMSAFSPLTETQMRHGYTQPHHPQQLRCTVRYSNAGRGTETDGTELCNLLFWDAIQPAVRLSQVPSKLAAVQPCEHYYENFGASKHGTFRKEELQPTFLHSQVLH